MIIQRMSDRTFRVKDAKPITKRVVSQVVRGRGGQLQPGSQFDINYNKLGKMGYDEIDLERNEKIQKAMKRWGWAEDRGRWVLTRKGYDEI
ncbi:MAG: hypothetical protein KAT14_07855 [Candidatus Marinimicrobia bacterium]|nr:hypothetical protein [Candidatus Neomarinimicrobiota bacterium]